MRQAIKRKLIGTLIGAQFVSEHVRMADALEYLHDALRGYAALQTQQPAPSVGAACYTGAQPPLAISLEENCVQGFSVWRWGRASCNLPSGKLVLRVRGVMVV